MLRSLLAATAPCRRPDPKPRQAPPISVLRGEIGLELTAETQVLARRSRDHHTRPRHSSYPEKKDLDCPALSARFSPPSLPFPLLGSATPFPRDTRPCLAASPGTRASPQHPIPSCHGDVAQPIKARRGGVLEPLESA
ncbi:unnamed protein product [Rangifer tarandus platyrhynchus]|uniref:Uncharacterized protein n=1 Tax=Rangifer tarandus platyrhynchus TaxID=3082113 RepID=A0ABN8XXX3_RANTA|nr:unnamed protein product [Rangifer tarandus platyrhynchus]